MNDIQMFDYDYDLLPLSLLATVNREAGFTHSSLKC